MNAAHFDVYYRRATQLADAMKLCQEDLHEYASAAGLLAVHSAISYSDALILSLGGKRPHGENHQTAVKTLELICSQKKIHNQKGIAHLRKLLQAKAEVSYGEKRTDSNKILQLCNSAARFQSWTENTLKSQNIGER